MLFFYYDLIHPKRKKKSHQRKSRKKEESVVSSINVMGNLNLAQERVSHAWACLLNWWEQLPGACLHMDWGSSWDSSHSEGRSCLATRIWPMETALPNRGARKPVYSVVCHLDLSPSWITGIYADVSQKVESLNEQNEENKSALLISYIGEHCCVSGVLW